MQAVTPAVLARALIALALGLIALALARKPFRDAEELVNRALLLTAALFLLSPAQFPWYYLWVLPLLACRPLWGLLVATVTLPLYYSAFYFMPRGDIAIFREIVAWMIWLPVWAVLAWETGLAGMARSRLKRLWPQRAPREAKP